MNCMKCGKELLPGDPGIIHSGLCAVCEVKPHNIALGKIWTPTLYMRWRIKQIACGWDQHGGIAAVRDEKVLQQLWRNELGAEEWRDVPTEGE